MNPWQDQEETSSSEEVIPSKDINFKFEDNFQPPLPDSKDYLASLERKLANLKKKHSSKDLVKSLSQRREDCMLRLLTEQQTNSHDQDLKLDTPVNNNHILRIISPEQAINLGELVELLKADQLGQVLSEEEDRESNISK